VFRSWQLAPEVGNVSRLSTAGLLDIAEKLDSGVRLDLSEGVRLFETPDLLSVGWLANREREKRHGGRTFHNYNINLRRELSLLLVREAQAWRSRRLHDVAR